MIKAVIFDLDDTLISEYDYVISGYSHVSNLLSCKHAKNKEEVFQELIKLFKEDPKMVFNRLFEKWELEYTQEDILELIEEYRNHDPSISFQSDVLPCLALLKNEGYKIGMITDGYASTQRRKIKVLESEQYFDHIIVTDELGKEYWKPHPKSFMIMKQKLDVDFEEMVYIGDNPSKDFYIQTYFPIKTVRIVRENNIYNKDYYFKEIKEDIRINNLKELAKVLKKFGDEI